MPSGLDTSIITELTEVSDGVCTYPIRIDTPAVVRANGRHLTSCTCEAVGPAGNPAFVPLDSSAATSSHARISREMLRIILHEPIPRTVDKGGIRSAFAIRVPANLSNTIVEVCGVRIGYTVNVTDFLQTAVAYKIDASVCRVPRNRSGIVLCIIYRRRWAVAIRALRPHRRAKEYGATTKQCHCG